LSEIRVFVVDDHPMIRHGLASMLAEDTNMVCVGEASGGAQALHAAPGANPLVVVMDLSMPEMDGIETMTALKPLLPNAHFVLLASVLDADSVRRALSAGAAGYLLKTATSLELLQAIAAAHNGQAAIAPEVALRLATSVASNDNHVGADLTQRERELLALMAQGLSNLDISTQMGIAMPTVKFHVTNILSKLHADNRTEAVLIALRNKLVSLL
jgi:NarL family two-component system response regulator LiaR